MPGLLVVAVALGLSNFGAAIGIGISGVRGATRIRVAVVFGLFEAGMPLLGLAIGRAADAGLCSSAARWGGAALLIAVGAYGLVQALRESGHCPRRDRAGTAATAARSAASAGPAAGGAGADRWGTGRMLVSGLALSVDNLAVGFVLGTYHVQLAVAVLVVGGVSVAMSLAGLELGAKAGAAAGQRGELVGAAVLIVVGAVMAAGVM
jgi:manganese efflux pump family protein